MKTIKTNTVYTKILKNGTTKAVLVIAPAKADEKGRDRWAIKDEKGKETMILAETLATYEPSEEMTKAWLAAPAEEPKTEEPKAKKAPAVTPETVAKWAEAAGLAVHAKGGAPMNLRLSKDGVTAHVNLTKAGATVYCQSTATAKAAHLIKDARAQKSPDRDIAFALSADDLKVFLPLYAAGIAEAKAAKAAARKAKRESEAVTDTANAAK